jgi:hypothetical protein
MNHPFEIIIPRDSAWVIPPMHRQNVTSQLNTTRFQSHHLLFNLHHVNIRDLSSISIHLELRPLHMNLSYLLIYRFDYSPVLNGSTKQIDGWTVFCPSSRLTIDVSCCRSYAYFSLLDQTNESIYTYFLDNQQTLGHQSVIFGLRELSTTDSNAVCSNNTTILMPPITNDRFVFTFDYELRLYTSGCYYLDEQHRWQSDGMIVSMQNM